MLTGFIKHKTNLTIAEERIGAALENTFPRNPEAQGQGASRVVNPIPCRAYYFDPKFHIDQNKKLGM